MKKKKHGQNNTTQKKTMMIQIRKKKKISLIKQPVKHICKRIIKHSQTKDKMLMIWKHTERQRPS